VEVPDYRKIGTTLAYNTKGYNPAGFGYLTRAIHDLPFCGGNFPIPFLDPISTVSSWIEGKDYLAN
jgi:hypothetical protein